MATPPSSSPLLFTSNEAGPSPPSIEEVNDAFRRLGETQREFNGIKVDQYIVTDKMIQSPLSHSSFSHTPPSIWTMQQNSPHVLHSSIHGHHDHHVDVRHVHFYEDEHHCCCCVCSKTSLGCFCNCFKGPWKSWFGLKFVNIPNISFCMHKHMHKWFLHFFCIHWVPYI